MLACAEICRTCAVMMLINTEFHKRTCRECAEIRAACATSCEQVGGMEDCVKACRACVDSCRKMAA
ncbi:hypothetical protein [Rhodopila sp.]|uniref:hypothetical protein n=1 Tax=Rhodopila sp. TaxID=2480087 RepID=UPI003D11C968